MAPNVVDVLHRTAVLSLLGVSVWTLWYAGALYMSRRGSKERFPIGTNPNQPSVSEEVMKLYNFERYPERRQQQEGNKQV